MPKCTQSKIDFGRLGRRVIEADFSGVELSSDGGLLLLRQVDRYLVASAARRPLGTRNRGTHRRLGDSSVSPRTKR